MLSVVIPTTGARAALLRRAITSALTIQPADSEVLVVLNGAGAETFNDAAMPPLVRCLRAPVANGNVARNAGLQAARGRYVRFLDDDDYLDSGALAVQVEALEVSGGDLCTGAVRIEDANGCETGRYIPIGDDFVADLLRQRPSSMTVGHLFRRKFLAGSSWDAARCYLQDVAWMHQLACRGEINWIPLESPVGACYTHDGARVSIDRQRASPHAALRDAAAIIGGTIDALESQGRMTPPRQQAAAKALWDYAHQGFQYSPAFWTPIAQRALALDPASRPGGPLLGSWPFRALQPVLAEWLAYPLRRVVRSRAR